MREIICDGKAPHTHHRLLLHIHSTTTIHQCSRQSPTREHRCKALYLPPWVHHPPTLRPTGPINTTSTCRQASYTLTALHKTCSQLQPSILRTSLSLTKAVLVSLNTFSHVMNRDLSHLYFYHHRCFPLALIKPNSCSTTRAGLCR